MSDLRFNALLLYISDQLTADQLVKLKFLVGDVVGKREQEKVQTGHRLFQLLSERGRLSAGNTAYLADLLRQVQRHDLAEKLEAGDSRAEPVQDELDDAEKAKLDIATEVIAENLGKSWRKLGRKLRLGGVKLESIANRHPTDLEETAVELLKEWRKSQGAGARTDELIRALRDCQFNLTADKVEEALHSQGL
ncbi:FAS-associated death domain protein [Menidia menidia]|uniref:(Atlantic silverside) hypothetical protein n=1 Tax=Menidia menidia TaxID=238744 RepID=A0A8S4A5N1_9TELE|nr:unnamed protein product [Menidia menidia]